MAEATIDELQIQIESDSTDASQSIDKLRQSLEKLLAPVQALTAGNGLNRLTKQLEKLAEAARAASSLSGFDKISQAATALKSLDNLTGNPKVGSYVTAINRLSQAAPAVQSIAAMPDISSQLSALTNALNTLRNVQDIRLTSLTNGLQQLPAAVQAINGMPAVDVSRIEALNTALSTFRTGSAQDIRNLVNALNKLPQVAQQINRIDFRQFENNIRQLTNSLEPLLQRAQAATQGLNSLATILRLVRSQSGNGNSMGSLSNTLGGLSTKSLLSWGSLLKLRRVLAECFQVSSQYVENLNLFNVTMGDSAKTAMEFAEKVNDALGIDTSDWVRYQGFFQSVGKGFGVTSEKADLMSKNLTQLAYDISSFYNISTDEAYNKVQSGFAGELEPLRRLGFALDEATLKQLAYSKGITQTYESMTQAQKSQLRYVAMIEQARNIGVTGDMSRTIDTAANGVRVLEARLQQFARAIGNMLMPMLSAILPYLTAFIQVVTEGANALANMLGFELPKINLDNVTSGYDDITAATEEATAATEKFKGSLAGVDQLNIIGSKSDKTGSGAGYSTDLDIELPTYDFLNGVESKTKEIAENMKRFFQEALPWIEAVAAAVGAIFLTTKVMNFVSALGKVFGQIRQFNSILGDKSKGFWGIAGGLAAGASSGILLYNSLKNIIKGTGEAANNWTQLGVGVGIAAAAVAVFIATGNPVGAVITLVGAAVGAVTGLISGYNEKIAEMNEQITSSILYNNGGTKISEVADAFEKWADAATKVNQKTIDKYSKLDEYTQKIEELLDDMGKFADVDFDLTELTSADAEELKKPFNELVDYLKGDFQDRCQTAADDLKDIFANLGIGGVIQEQVLDGYEKMKETFDANLTASQATVNKYLDKVAQGGTLTEAEQAQFQKDYSYIMESAKNTDPTYIAAVSAVSELEQFDLNNLDLESPDDVKAALEKVDSAVTSFVSSAEERYNAEIGNINMLRAQVETDYKYGKISKNQYDEQIGLLDFSESLAAQNYKSQVSDIFSRVSPIYQAIANKYGEAASSVIPDFSDRVAMSDAAASGLIPDNLTPDQQVADVYAIGQGQAAEKWLDGNEGYQAFLGKIDHINELAQNVEFDIVPPTAGTAAREMYDALDGSGIIDLDAKIKFEVDLPDPNAEYKEIVGIGADDYSGSDFSVSRLSGNTQATGYARDAVADSFKVVSTGNNPVEAPANDIYISLNVDGEELANYVVRAQSGNTVVTNGR